MSRRRTSPDLEVSPVAVFLFYCSSLTVSSIAPRLEGEFDQCRFWGGHGDSGGDQQYRRAGPFFLDWDGAGVLYVRLTGRVYPVVGLGWTSHQWLVCPVLLLSLQQAVECWGASDQVMEVFRPTGHHTQPIIESELAQDLSLNLFHMSVVSTVIMTSCWRREH